MIYLDFRPGIQPPLGIPKQDNFFVVKVKTLLQMGKAREEIVEDQETIKNFRAWVKKQSDSDSFVTRVDLF